jgi:hypothetical protein
MKNQKKKRRNLRLEAQNSIQKLLCISFKIAILSPWIQYQFAVHLIDQLLQKDKKEKKRKEKKEKKKRKDKKKDKKKRRREDGASGSGSDSSSSSSSSSSSEVRPAFHPIHLQRQADRARQG